MSGQRSADCCLNLKELILLEIFSAKVEACLPPRPSLGIALFCGREKVDGCQHGGVPDGYVVLSLGGQRILVEANLVGGLRR